MNLLTCATIFYNLVLFGAICSFFVLFAAVCCVFAAVCWDVLLLVLFATRVAPNLCQNAPQRPQNTPKIDPKSTQNCHWERPGAPRSHSIPIFYFWTRFWRHFGAPKGPKIDQKSQLFLKNRVVIAILSRVVCPRAFFIFFFDFSSIFGTPEPWKSLFFLRKTTIFKKTTF